MPNSVLPISIAQVAPGMVVRIQLVGGFVFVPVGFDMADVMKNTTPRPYRTSIVVGNVTQNDYPNRRIQIAYQELQRPRLLLTATVPYARIRVMEKQLQGTLVSDNVHRLRIPAYTIVHGI